jgi:hypothetical protein
MRSIIPRSYARTMRRLVATLSALLLVVALAGCGDDGTAVTVDPLAAVLAAPEKTVEAESAKVAIDMTMVAEGQEITLTGEGVMSLTEALGTLTFEMNGIPGAGRAVIEQIVDGTMLYVRSELFSASGVDTPWVSIDLEEIGEMAGVDVSQLGGQQNDPTQTLAYLEGAADDVEEVGKENVRGVETTHYRATVDLAKAAENAGAVTDPEAFEKIIDQIGTETVDVDVWIDEDGRARRMAQSMPMNTEQGSVDVDTAMEFFDFGTEVDVEPPPADQVTDLAEVLGQVGAGAQQ